MRRQSAVLIGCVVAAVFAASSVEAKRYQRYHRTQATKVKNLAQEPAKPATSDIAPEQAAAAVPAPAPTPAPAATPSLPPLLAALFQPAAAAAPPPLGLAQPAAAEAPPPVEGTMVVERNTPLRELVAKHAAANGVPFSLAHAVIMIESKYTARIAHAGNYGLMQIRAQTARGMGFTGSAVGLLDAETNLRFGMKYLALAYRMAHGDTCGTVMRYQSGVGTIRMNASNRAYCAKARSYMAHL